MNSMKNRVSSASSVVVKETQSFTNLHLLGILTIQTALRNLPSEERFNLAQHCIDFSVRVGGPPWSRSSVPPPPYGSVVETLVPVKGKQDAVSSWSTLAGHTVSVNIGPDSIELLNSDRQLLCQHPRRKLGAVVAPPGKHNALVYVGHDALSDYRLAVIVGMADREAAKEAARHFNNTELRSMPPRHIGDGHPNPPQPALPPRSHHPRPSAGERHSTATNFEDHDYENDPFYDNFGFNCGEQEKLYDPVVLVVDAPRKKKMSDEVLFQHLHRFVEDERDYCVLLDDLIQVRSESNDNQLRHALKHLLEIRTFHAKLLKKLTSDAKPLTIQLISGAFTSLADDMRSYVDYLRVTQSVDEVARIHLYDNKKAMGDLVQTRKRIITYHLKLETWLDATASSVQYDKLLKTINTLKQICKEADTMMLIAGVRKAPYCLKFYLPLIRHGNFSVEGKGFKKNQWYKLLLFPDLLIFAISSYEHLECVEALRLEKLNIIDDKRSDKGSRIKLKVDHSERRGTEVIQLSGVSDSTGQQFKDDIEKLLEKLTTKISQAYTTTSVDQQLKQ